jgi:hypothetical protein
MENLNNVDTNCQVDSLLSREPFPTLDTMHTMDTSSTSSKTSNKVVVTNGTGTADNSTLPNKFANLSWETCDFNSEEIPIGYKIC